MPRWVPPASLALVALGLAVSAYLTIVHFTTAVQLSCPDTGAINCVKVTTSPQSKFLGVPVALLGLLYFAALVPLYLPRPWRSPLVALRAGRVVATVGGVGFVLYLISVELTLGAICLYCTVVHVATVALFATTAIGTALSVKPASDDREP